MKKKSLVGWTHPQFRDHFVYWKTAPFGEEEISGDPIVRYKRERNGLIRVRVTIEEITPPTK